MQGGWQCGRRVVSQLQNGQRALNFLFAASLRAHFRHFFTDLTDSRQRSKKQTLHLICRSPEAIENMNICYILDGILILYGIILTVLYCRLRMHQPSKAPANPPEKQPAEGGIYAGLSSHTTDTYETIKIHKKPIA